VNLLKPYCRGHDPSEIPSGANTRRKEGFGDYEYHEKRSKQVEYLCETVTLIRVISSEDIL